MKRLPTKGSSRTHKIMYVDFGNPFYRDYLPKWIAKNKENFDQIRMQLPKWAAEARASELALTKKENRQPRPLAVVLDIDEVLLCNIRDARVRDARMQDVQFDLRDYFQKWEHAEVDNPLMPGALELLRAIVALKIQPFFITGRLESTRAETIENFVRAGVVGPGGPIDVKKLSAGPNPILIMRPTDMALGSPKDASLSLRTFKEPARGEISKKYRIILNIGDQVSDLGNYGDRQYYLPHAFYFTL